jgi:hypothetical protein
VHERIHTGDKHKYVGVLASPQWLPSSLHFVETYSDEDRSFSSLRRWRRF